MSSGICSSATRFDRAAASPSSSAELPAAPPQDHVGVHSVSFRSWTLRGYDRPGAATSARLPMLGRAVTEVGAARDPSRPLPPRRASATPSLRRIAETWWSTVRVERTSSEAISAFRFPAARSCSTSTSRAVSAAGLARVAGRGPRGTALPRAWSACRDELCRRAAPSRRAPRALRGAPPRRPPPQAHAPPRTGTSAHASAGCGRGRLRRPAAGTAPRSTPAPRRVRPAFHCQYASSPPNHRCRLLERERVHRPRLLCRSARGRRRARPPRPARRARAQAAAGARRCTRELERLVERLPGAGIAAARAHAAERDEPGDPGDRLDRRGSDGARAGRSLFPAALVDRDAGRARRRVRERELVRLGADATHRCK